MKHHHKQTTNSTQDDAKQDRWDCGLKEWKLYTADEQHNGRATKNRIWASPPDVNIYATYRFLVPAIDAEKLIYIPQVAALAIAKTLKEFEFSPTIKWVNDVLLNGKKVSGILSESASYSAGHQEYRMVYLGVGINVNATVEQLSSVDQPVTSMLIEANKPFDKNIILNKLSQHLQQHVSRLLERGFSQLSAEINPFIELYYGRAVVFDASDDGSEGNLIKGTIEGIDCQGALRLRVTDTVKTYINGRILPP